VIGHSSRGKSQEGLKTEEEGKSCQSRPARDLLDPSARQGEDLRKRKRTKDSKPLVFFSGSHGYPSSTWSFLGVKSGLVRGERDRRTGF